MQPLRIQIRNYLVPALVGIVAVLGALFSFQSVVSTLSVLPTLYGELQSLQIETKGALDKGELLANLNQTELSMLIAQSEKALPKDKDVGGILSAITNAKTQTGVNVRSLSLSPGLVSSESGEPTGVPPVTDQQFSVVIDGTMGQMMSFLEYLTHGRRLFSVRDIKLSFFAEGQIQATIEMIAHYFPDPVVVTTIDQTLTEFSAEERNVLNKVEALPLISVPLEGTIPLEAIPGRSNYFGL